ncbi:MAG: acyl-CoA thioesterase, partial [Candidatus Bathyarchaeota archaeon]|nr:acyl-CoA thioesterase [Candidatus Bathyarchaeota archaeon]
FKELEEALLMQNICKISLRVRAGDTDFTGFAYNVRCLEWFSVGRIELFRSLGIQYSSDGSIIINNEEQNVSFVIGEVYAKFHSPARFDDLLELETEIEDIGEKILRFEHNIYKKIDGRLLVSGHSVYICIDKKSVKSIKIPLEIRTLLDNY